MLPRLRPSRAGRGAAQVELAAQAIALSASTDGDGGGEQGRVLAHAAEAPVLVVVRDAQTAKQLQGEHPSVV